MKIIFTDHQRFFPQGRYKAKAVKLEPYKTRYGVKLLIWFEIKNEYGKTMLVNDFFPYYGTANNRTAKIFKTMLHKKELGEVDTEDLIGKELMVTLRSKKSKADGKYYLNIVKYAPVKEPKKKPLKVDNSKREGGIKSIKELLGGGGVDGGKNN